MPSAIDHDDDLWVAIKQVHIFYLHAKVELVR